ncbi:hypothetical protein WAI453_001041 [Rhynchosporium graminicola]|uniref:Uncharacterized protein n=1 Tax=Rhynchosporium graminicola TaxID=2792576 RepID=A0A1E1K602_9HELO|nr:uncharacterized protein RCO7_10568 [Rhynchosporium commune]
MFSPPPREKARASDSDLPEGGCRYIMLHPEVKGLRCACVGFALNRTIPAGSTCDCGHQACYHIPWKEHASVERRELEALRKKIDMLEVGLDRARSGDRGGFVDRLGRLEELVDRTRGETETEFKSVYRAQSSLFSHIGNLTKRTPYYEDHIEALEDGVQGIRNQLEEMDDASMRLEDKVDALEKTLTLETPMVSRRRKASTPPSLRMDNDTECSVISEEYDTSLSPTTHESRLPSHLVMTDELSRISSFRERVSSVGSGSQSWTLHVSLLPTSSQPFPFEKDTAAYKRCLSRGLHQVVVIPDTDAVSFRKAVSDAFANIIHGRPWHPLVARLCDAKNLRGLPMLRQLDDYLFGSSYDADFLQRNCAVNDESGKILDLYIAMASDTISWSELEDTPSFKPGLEDSWLYDPLLDGPSRKTAAQDLDTSRPAAGDIITAWSPTLKRNVSEISRAPSFGSSEAEGTRPKIARCTETAMKLLERRAEKV